MAKTRSFSALEKLENLFGQTKNRVNKIFENRPPSPRENPRSAHEGGPQTSNLSIERRKTQLLQHGSFFLVFQETGSSDTCKFWMNSSLSHFITLPIWGND